jgi:hypothetical protein
MADDSPQELGTLAKVVFAVAAVMIVAGVLWHGIRTPRASGTTWSRSPPDR